MNERIVVDPKILAGKPVVRGTRIPVYLILNYIANGKTAKEIINDYPELKQADIVAALSYAASHMRYEETKPVEAAS